MDPRRIGTDVAHVDTMTIRRFNYETLLEHFYSPKGENYHVSIDMVDGEKLYKVSYQGGSGVIFNSYWIDPQRGYNLVRANTESEVRGLYVSYTVTLDKFPSQRGDVWFPQKISYKYRMNNTITEEEVVIDSIAFDVQDYTPFTLAGLGIPVGFRVTNHLGDVRPGGEIKYWDGEKLVDSVPLGRIGPVVREPLP